MAIDGTGLDLRHHGDAEVGPGLIDFAVNVRPGAPPDWLARRLRGCVGDLAAYPDPRLARAALASRHGRDPAEVLPTAGAAEAFVLLARVVRPRRAVVVHPQFTEPEAALRAAGHEPERVVLAGEFTLGPAPPVPDDADLVIIGNPTNPTSVLHPAAAIAALARPGRTLVVDEAFMDCVPGEPASLAAGRRPDLPGLPRLPGLVVVRSLTKTWGLAGLRAGYLLADPELVEALAAAQPLWAVSTPALVAMEACSAPKAVRAATDWAAGLAVERERFAARLTALGLHVVPGARASFLCVRTPDACAVRTLLRERGYAVRRGDTFPGLGPDWLRVAVRDRAADDGFLDVLTQVLGELAA
jgi:histidinol-phosphate aminotransferase